MFEQIGRNIGPKLMLPKLRYSWLASHTASEMLEFSGMHSGKILHSFVST